MPVSRRHARCWQNTTDEHLMTPWRFMVGDHVVSENPRHVMIADSVFSHLAHHRGTVDGLSAAQRSIGVRDLRSVGGRRPFR